MKALTTLLAVLSLITLLALIFVLRENARLRQENEALRATASAIRPADVAPTFRHRFLVRGACTNAGLANPVAALQTFFWAFVSNEDALKDVSVLDGNNEPVQLTGMALDWRERLLGLQPLSFDFTDPKQPEIVVATVITQTRSSMIKNNVPFEGIAHGILKLRFEKIGDEWRFAGKER